MSENGIETPHAPMKKFSKPKGFSPAMSNNTDNRNRTCSSGGDFVRYIAGRDSRQMAMGVWSVEDEVSRESPARFIEVFVDIRR